MDVAVGRLLDRGFCVAADDPVPPAAVDPVEFVWLDRRHDSPDLARGQRDEVRIAPHEAHVPPVGPDGDGVAGEQRPSTLGPASPMEDSAPFEVPARLDQRYAWERLDTAFPVFDRGIGPHHPLAIRLRDIDRRVPEGATPLHVDAVEVRVRHRDAVEAAARADGRDALVVDEAEAVPQEVASGRLDEQRTLPDADGWIGTESAEPRLEVAHLDAVAFPAEPGQGDPALPTGWDVLPLVIADRAMRRRLFAFRLLDAACPADVGVHRLTIQSPDHGDGARDRRSRAAARGHCLDDAAAAVDPAVRAIRSHHPDQARGHAGGTLVQDSRRL